MKTLTDGKHNSNSSHDIILDTPILLIIYNRLETTKQVFERIRKVKPRKFYIAADGPKDNAEEIQKQKILDVRKWVLDNVDWECDVHTCFAEKNMGCKERPHTAITWALSNEDRMIILEDDIVPDISFFIYCEEMLEKYKDDTRIMTVSGYKAVYDFPIEEDYFFSFFSPIWGWGTWKRAWDKYDPKIVEWPKAKKDKILKKYFRRDTQYFLSKNFDTVYRDEIDAWDYQWHFIRILNEGLGIVPKHNLVKNIGYNSEEATHTTGIAPEFPVESLEFPLSETTEVIRNIYYDEAYEKMNYVRHRGKDLLRKVMPKWSLELYKSIKKRYQGNNKNEYR